MFSGRALLDWTAPSTSLRAGLGGGPYVLWAAVDRNVMLWIWRSDVIGTRADEAVVVELLDHVGGPSADAGHGKNRGEEVDVDPQRVIRGSRIKIYVRVQFLFRFYEVLNPAGHLKPLALAAGVPEIARHLPQVCSARVFGVINAMAKAGNLFLLC